MSDQRGFLMLAAILLIVAVGAFMAALTSLYISSTRSSQHHLASMKAFYIAQSGLERARYALKSQYSLSPPTPADKRLDCNEIDIIDNFGEGQFHVVGIGSNPTPGTALSASILPTDSVIPVLSLIGYATPEGFLEIGDEALFYTGTSTAAPDCSPYAPPCFTGVLRGQNDTTASNYAAGKVVEQNMCKLESTGVVPSFATVQGKRVVELLLPNGNQNAFVVGQQDQGELIVEWNGTGWDRHLQSDLAGDSNLYSIDMISSFDGWAVGAQTNDNVAFIAHYDGAQALWVEDDFDNDVANTNLRSVSCIDSDYCWAVGDKKLGKATIARYYGTASPNPLWTDSGFINTAPNLNLNAVYCPDDTVCWAGGQNYVVQIGIGIAAIKIIDEPLILKYDPNMVLGGIWDRAVSPSYFTNNGPANSHINHMECLDADNCWAVGGKGAQGKGFILKYDSGTNAWNEETNYALGVPNKEFYGITCVDFNDCWVVGQKVDGGNATIYHYDGTNWTELTDTTTPANNTTSHSLHAVACYNTDDCWAVGEQGRFAHWDGVSWESSTYNDHVDSSLDVPVTKELYAIDLIRAVGNGKPLWRENFHSFAQPAP